MNDNVNNIGEKEINTNDSFSNMFYSNFGKPSTIEKYNFYDYLAIMLDGGLSIINALEGVAKRTKTEGFRRKIKELTLFISSGDSLSKSMKKLPDIFNSSETSIIEAGEKSGTVINSLSILASEMKKAHELKQKVKGSLAYPSIIILFLVLAVIIVLTYVIPTLRPLIESTGADLPASTKALIATSEFLIKYYILIIFLILFFVLIFIGYKSTEAGKKSIDNLLLKIPLLGDVYKNYIIATSSSILGVLMHSGVPIVKSMILVGKSTNNAVYENLFNDISMKVGTGKTIVQSMTELDENNKYFPSDFLQLLSVGEKTASIDKVCVKLNEQYNREVDYSLSILTKWIEPISILIVGGFVLWFAFAIFGSILRLTETVGY